MLADVNGDGQTDFVTGTRFMGRNTPESEPLAIYWYEWTATGQKGAPGAVTWTRHAISTGGEAGTGLQIAAGDIDKDGDIDFAASGKSGLFVIENLRRK